MVENRYMLRRAEPIIVRGSEQHTRLFQYRRPLVQNRHMLRRSDESGADNCAGVGATHTVVPIPETVGGAYIYFPLRAELTILLSRPDTDG